MNILKSLCIFILGVFLCAGCTRIFTPEPLYSYLYGIFFAVLYLAGVVFFQTERILQKIKEPDNAAGTELSIHNTDEKLEL